MLEFPLLCRLCGLKTGNGLYIYCDEGKRRQVETKIRLYLHFQVFPSDSLPKKICASCFEELEGMHRFAINALKVQDNLSKISQDLPSAAIDGCKTFMASYVHEPVMVNDTVASLTNQEVTEMEVQIDPMIFLEDDQLDNPEEENGVFEAAEDSAQCMPQNGDHKILVQESNEVTPVCKPLEGTGLAIVDVVDSTDENRETDEKLQNTAPSSLLEPKHISALKSEENSQEVKQSVIQNSLPEGKMSNNSDELIDNVAASSDLDYASHEDSGSPEPAVFRKSRKGIIKNSKKNEPKLPSLENIKCITYTCPICKKVFMKRGPFKVHLDVHRTDHKYACEICLRVFRKENNLNQHKKSHTQMATFPCTHCNRIYPTMSTLRSHLVSHSDERPHVCSICSKSFKRNQDLKFHLNQHNGLRPYQCPYCTKAFSSSGNCFSHRRRAHMLEIERDRALQKVVEPTN